MVDFGLFGLVGSVCVLCCGGSERSVLVLLHLGFGSCWSWDFDGDDFVVSWKTVILYLFFVQRVYYFMSITFFIL